MTIQLHDNGKHLAFAPLTLTRPVGNLRIGILTNDARWQALVPDLDITFDTEDYLNVKFPNSSGRIVVNACVIPNASLARQIIELNNNEELIFDNLWIARRGSGNSKVVFVGAPPLTIEHRWDLYKKNGAAIQNDFDILTSGRTSVQLSSSNTIIGDPGMIFMEEGAIVEAALLNTKEGPIYIVKNAEIMEGSMVRGPFAMNESSVLKLGTKVYGPTTLGPHCKVGGEVNNVVFQAYSNKGHDGFLGNSLVGEWCNIGADTNTSNLKNNYGMVRVYSYETNTLEETNLQFMGLTLGDHSKCGINTMFNTATIVGVSCNIFGAEFPPKHVPSFSWGAHGEIFEFNKAIGGANNMMSRRGLTLTDAEISILRHIADKN